jgi:diguanylate cyclase (GGDEF)-like protein
MFAAWMNPAPGFSDTFTMSQSPVPANDDPGEAKIAEFRGLVLSRFLYIATALAVFVLPAYWVIGLNGLTISCCVFFVLTTVFCYLHNVRHVARACCAHGFIGMTVLVTWTGIAYGSEFIDNKPWQMLVPMLAYLIAGSRRGTAWVCLHLLGLVALFYVRRHAYEPLSVAILLLAYPSLAYGMYVFTRANETNIRTISRLSHTDSLTKTYNRQLFEELFVNMFNRARRAGEPLAVYMIDIDHFKKYNDNYGHIAGDRALKQVADVIRGSARRASDLVFRYGGEEFCVVSSGVNSHDALVIAESIIEGVRRLDTPHVSGENGRLTVSIGLTYGDSLDDLDTEALLRRADRALYAAKTHGRNRIDVDRHGVAVNAALAEAS